MATYPGMNLRGEVRESVSIDEEDLSDVEDEVFIRDGKNGYKFEDMSVKKPLMAPRRKVIKPNFTTRVRYKTACRNWCRPCCYAFTALTVLIGLIVLVIIMVSLFPLPLDTFRHWIVSNKNNTKTSIKLLPCSDLKVTDVWSTTFPNIISESSIRSLDVNQDGVQDVIFGFGTSDDNLLPSELFCPMFMGKSPPCQGGIMAINGINGSVIWKYWLPHSVFTIICSVDINLDNITDCLVTGKGGIFLALNMREGTLLWQFSDKTKQPLLIMDIYSANFIPDQDGDGIADIIAAHTSQKGRSRSGVILIVSGKLGRELQRVSTPNNVESYYSPQILPQQDGNYSILIGTGSPTSPGNLSVVDLKNLMSGNMTLKTIYQDPDKGVLSPSILVDITGDTILDIVTAMFNSTIVAINGKTFKQIWNYTINSSETLSVPVPGYFNSDNITDFLIKYQTGSTFPTYHYSQTLIIDGKTGKPIYKNPIIDSVGSQMGGITLGMEGFGYDFLLFWTSNCKNHEGNKDYYEFVPGSNIYDRSRSDLCKLRYNSSTVAKLYALNQFDQPPGIEIYNSENWKSIEHNQSVNPIEVAKVYMNQHPELGSSTNPSSEESSYESNSPDQFLNNRKYPDGSSFRHKDNGQGLIRDFGKKPKTIRVQQNKADYDQEDSWSSKTNNQYDLDNDYSNSYLDETEPESIYNSNKLLNENNRDPRGDNRDSGRPTKKNLSEEKYGIYDYKNIRDARGRLMHDLESPPDQILRDTYFKKREMQLRKSKFEARDLQSHEDKIKENEEIKKVLDKEKAESYNQTMTLWDLESEKELEEKKTGLWRGKREINSTNNYGVPKITSVGTIVQSLNTTTNSIDLLLITYWLPPKNNAQILLNKDFDCINKKLKEAAVSKDQMSPFDKKTFEEIFMKECLKDRGVQFDEHNRNVDSNLKNFQQISHLKLGQLTLHRFRIECVCQAKKGEKCAKFLDVNNQSWPSYLGQNGDGIFKARN